MYRSSHQRCSIKKGVFKNFAKFTWKHQCKSLFFKKETLAQVFSCGFCKIINNTYLKSIFKRLFLNECAKFRGSRAIVGPVGLVTSYHRAFVGISWVQNISSWVFCGSKIFSRGSKIFLVGNFVIFSSWLHEKKWYRYIWI